MALVEAFFPLELRPLVQQSIRSQDKEGEKIARKSPGVVVSGQFPFPFLDSWTFESWQRKKQYQILDVALQDIQHHGGNFPWPARHCFPSILPLCQASCFRKVRNMARPENFMGTGSLLTCCEMSQSEAGVCDAMQQIRPWVGIPAEALCTTRANPYPE